MRLLLTLTKLLVAASVALGLVWWLDSRREQTALAPGREGGPPPPRPVPPPPAEDPARRVAAGLAERGGAAPRAVDPFVARPAADGRAAAADGPVAAAPLPEREPTGGGTATAASPTVPLGAVAAADGACPDSHPVKGNADSHIYHLPGGPSYDRTVAEFCFASAGAAEAAGFRAPRRAHPSAGATGGNSA